MVYKIQILILALVIPFAGFYYYTQTQHISVTDIFVPGIPIMHIGKIPLRVRIADTELLRAQGLSGLETFPKVNGMLFIFDTPDYHGIWMKDMHFLIDVIWISENLKVVGITKGLSPSSYPKIFYPPSPIKYAVETDTDYAETFGINIGNIVVLPSGLGSH